MDDDRILKAIAQMEQRIMSEIQGVRADIKALDTKMDRRFDETTTVMHEVAETVTDRLTAEIEEVKTVTAANCYDIASLKRRA